MPREKTPKAGKRTTPNKTGTALERFIKDLLVANEYAHVPHYRFEAAKSLGQKIFAKQMPIGQGIYKTNLKCDFIIYHPTKFKEGVIIESKWQQTGGTADEKLPYTIMNIQLKYPLKTILLIDGRGFRPQAIEWVREQQGNNLMKVFSMAEFQAWANRNL